MSADNLRRIADAFAEKVAHLDRVPHPIGLLAEFTIALGRDSGEHVFFKVQTEPGWTQEEAQALADKSIHGHVIAIADTMHAHGGTIEMAQDLVR
ncbi:hypothetical protein ACRAWG_15105 [Methylobacterium sp. P31]